MQRKKQMNVMRAYRLVDVRFFSFGIADVTFFESVPRSAKQLECPAMRGGMTRLESVEPPLAHGHVVVER